MKKVVILCMGILALSGLYGTDIGELDPNMLDNTGNTALMSAAARGDIVAILALGELRGIDPNIQNNDGNTALMLAILNGNLRLVEATAAIPNTNFNLTNREGLNAFEVAAEIGNPQIMIVVMLARDRPVF
ncbi:hypothetical protein A3F06_04370 [candidate division TM6 bacterium RIFCSPHIGHO2_12_FULL_36_22]|nr:MAG: hypothetical protein A3F06_04370 [candidate division TM6 bacterium RIFCSPHIGHO2_12_FULL_36_22]